MSSSRITDIPALEACLGTPSTSVLMKVIDHIDEGAAQWLAQSPIGFVAIASEGNLIVSACGGEMAFAFAADENHLCLPLALVDRKLHPVQGDGAGTLFLIPGIGETLRINGKVDRVENDLLYIAVEECYIHCAKALIRSAFWSVTEPVAAPLDPGAFLENTRFLALATLDAEGRVDVSPKGDPSGRMIASVEGAPYYAERPGNRRADSYRNMIANPSMAAVAVIPGSNVVAHLRGTGEISSDESIRSHFVVQGKAPILVTSITNLVCELTPSGALGRASLWPAESAPAHISPAKMFMEHVRLNKAQSEEAANVRAALTSASAVQASLEKGYKENLY